MNQLRPEKLHVDYLAGITQEGPVVPRVLRRYTLTHPDMTSDFFLSMGRECNRRQISGLYTRLMRDEVLTEWKKNQNGASLHVCCRVSGGVVIGRAGWRESIFRTEMQSVLECIRHGGRELSGANPELDSSTIFVHFQSSKGDRTKIETWERRPISAIANPRIPVHAVDCLVRQGLESE